MARDPINLPMLARAAIFSGLYWLLGLACLLMCRWVGIGAASAVPLGWLSVVTVPPTVAMVTWIYRRSLGEHAGHRANWYLAWALLAIHIPADAVVGLLFFPEVMRAAGAFLIVWYVSFAAVPRLVK